MNIAAHIGRWRVPKAAAIWRALIVMVAVGSADACMAAPTSLPRRDDIRNAAAQVGTHYRSAKPCSASTCPITSRWDDAVLMMGMIEHWRRHRTAAYRTYAENWANRNAWKLFSDTRGSDQRNPSWHNRMTAGYTYLRLLQAGSPGATVADVAANLDAQLALRLSPEREQLVNYVFPGATSPSFSWKEVDAEFMGLPAWIIMGKHAGRDDYYVRARDLQNYQVDVLGLQDAATKLWYRDERTKADRSPSGQKIFWGRGTGWIAGALAIALSELPASRPEYATYRTRYTDLMNAVRTRQRADGFWNMNVMDPTQFPAPETSGTALITFAIARGIDLGILSRATYEPVAAKAWNAMVATSVRNDGYLGFCQSIGRAPVPPTDASYPDEGLTAETSFCVGAFLLAGAAMHDIATTAGTSPVTTYQGETLATTVSSGDSQADVSHRYARGGRANSATLRAKGDFVEFTAPNVPNGTHRLRVRFRRDTTHGIWQLKTNGVKTGDPVDGYDVDPHYAEVEVGPVTYSGGPATKRYRFEVTGKNASSSSFRVGIDTIRLVVP